MQDTVHQAQDSEERRDQQFRDNETERDRQFLDNERRRVDGGVGGMPGAAVHLSPEQMEAVRETVVEALRSPEAREAARAEREAADAEHQRLRDEVATEHARMLEDRDARIAELQKELDRARHELEDERGARLTEENEIRERQRAENIDRDDAFRDQLRDITDIAQNNRDCCMENKEFMEQRYQEKMERRPVKDAEMARLVAMVEEIRNTQAAELERQEDERRAAEGKPGRHRDSRHRPLIVLTPRADIERVLAELEKQNGELREALNLLSDSRCSSCLQSGCASDHCY
jgi:hypothetical protein